MNNIDKSKVLKICFFGEKEFFLRIKTNLSFEKYNHIDCNFVHFENDHNINSIITNYNPDIFLTINGEDNFNFLNVQPYEVRKKWLSISESEINKNITDLIFNRYINCIYSDNEYPLISVFTPTYKTSYKILKPLESLLNQTYKNWEWVIYDDSDDDEKTFNLLKEISKIDHRIKIFKSNAHSGKIGQTKKYACGLCSGEFLCELDHDDELTEKCLEYIVKTFQKYKDVGFCYTDYAYVREDTGESIKFDEKRWSFGYGKFIQSRYKNKFYNITNGLRINPLTLRSINSTPNHARAWRKSFYDKIGGHNINLPVGDDFDIIIRSFLFTKISYIPKFGYIQNINYDGNTHVDRNKEIFMFEKIINHYYNDAIKTKFKSLNINDMVSDVDIDKLRMISQYRSLENKYTNLPHVDIVSDVN